MTERTKTAISWAVIWSLSLAMLAATASAVDYYGIYGNSDNAGDTVRINFATLSGGVSGNVADPDSLVVLRFFRGSLLDSVMWSGTDNAVKKLRTGYFEYAARASNVSGDEGQYTIFRVVFDNNGSTYPGFAGCYLVLDGGIMSLADTARHFGLDWGNVSNASASLNLSGTRFFRADTVMGDVGLSWSTRSELAGLVADSMEADGRMLAATSDTVGMIYDSLAAITGGGAYACTLFAYSSTDTSAIPGTFVRTLNASQTTTIARGTTDTEGRLVLALDDGSYKLWPSKAGYVFSPLPQTLIVSSGATDTVWAAPFDPGQPPVPDLCRVYGWVFDVSATQIENLTVKAGIDSIPVRSGSIVISPHWKSTKTDADGYWYLDLYPNSDITPAGTQYQFELYYSSGAVLRKKVEVPDQSSWQLTW